VTDPTTLEGLACRKHSLKNRTGPAVEPEKTGTSDLSGFLSALNRPANEPKKPRKPTSFLEKPVNRAVYSESTGSMPFLELPLVCILFV